MAKTVTKRKAKSSSKVAQKPNPTLSRTNKRSAKEMQEWYEKNKNTIETFKKAQDALDLLQVQNPTKSATKAFSTFTKENLRTYLENPFSNSKNLRNLSKYLYYRSQVYRRLIQYNANMINLQYRSVIPPFNITEDNDPQTVLQSYADTLSLLEKMNLNLAFKPACITAFREDVFFGCAYLDDTGFFILPIDPDYCKIAGVYGDGSLAFWMDMTYFQKNADYLEYWGEPFQTMWKEYQKGTLNGIPSIGIQIHKPGQPEVEDMQVDLVSGKTMDLDMLRYYSEINVEETAIQKICELVENLQDVEIVGKIPENISAERIMRGFDPKGEIYNEE